MINNYKIINGVACLNTGRKFIGIELETKYFEITKERLRELDMYE